MHSGNAQRKVGAGGEPGGVPELVLGMSDTWSPYWDRHTELVVSSRGLEPDVDAATVRGATDWLTVLLPASRCRSPPA